MISKIEELLSGRDDKIDYDEILSAQPWIAKENNYCILSPDSDGLLCGLFMSHYLNWKIAGFYDGKIMVVNKELINSRPSFLDMEIFRENINSIGQHMLLVNRNKIPEKWIQFKHTINPNNLRLYDGKHAFRLKYPLATIHLLIGIIAHYFYTNKKQKLTIPQSAIPALFFTDGVFNVLFSYPENVLNWLNYLRINEEWHPLKEIFENEKYTVFTLMKEMNSFFRKRDEISHKKERGDRLKISDKNGTIFNIVKGESGDYHIDEKAKERTITFIKMLSDLTGWEYKEDSWSWDKMKLYTFTKSAFAKDKLTITTKNFEDFINTNPLSWAMTSGTNIEYTKEGPDKMF